MLVVNDWRQNLKLPTQSLFIAVGIWVYPEVKKLIVLTQQFVTMKIINKRNSIFY